MKLIDDNFMVCADCIQVIANGDYSGLDYYYSHDAAAARVIEIDNGIKECGGYPMVGDSEKDEEFSTCDCDCCGSPLAGSRHHCVIGE